MQQIFQVVYRDPRTTGPERESRGKRQQKTEGGRLRSEVCGAVTHTVTGHQFRARFVDDSCILRSIVNAVSTRDTSRDRHTSTTTYRHSTFDNQQIPDHNRSKRYLVQDFALTPQSSREPSITSYLCTSQEPLQLVPSSFTDDEVVTEAQMVRVSARRLATVFLVGSCVLAFTILAMAHARLPTTEPYLSMDNGPGWQKPPLPIDGWNITGDVNWLLDFAIVGFPKTGTSTLMFYFRNQSDSVFIHGDERCEIGYNQHVRLLRDMYRHYRPSMKFAIKCPRDLENGISLANYAKFFPRTKFVIGIREPTMLFESFYNFRITNEYDLPPTDKMIGRCKRALQGVCTERVRFAKHLQRIEKSRPVFLYNLAQLYDKNEGRSRRFRKDLRDFLGLEESLDAPMIWIKPGRAAESDAHAVKLEKKKIDICDDMHSKVRETLRAHANESSSWILTEFLHHWNVTVSSPQYFLQLLSQWKSDPCSKRLIN